MKCQCESTKCQHGEHSCSDEPILLIRTIYGKYRMCLDCAANLPERYYADKNDKVERTARVIEGK